MDKPKKDMDAQEQAIQKLAEDIDPSRDVIPDSVAEATTIPLDDGALGGNATQDDVNTKNGVNNKKK